MDHEMFPADVVRTIWPDVGQVTQVNHGSFGRVPAETIAEVKAWQDLEEANPQAWFRELPERVATARLALAAWLGTDPERTALVSNASAGMTVALNSITEDDRGRKIIFTDHAYGAVRYAIERACARTGAVPTVVPIPLNASDDEIVAALSAEFDGAAMLVVDQITSPTAKLLPVARLTEQCRAAGVAIAVDGAHTPGQLAAPLEGLEQADFWTGNLHKWACTPRGTAALVVAEDRLDTVPLVASWNEYEPFARRFDAQGTGVTAHWLAAPHAVDLIEERLGWEQVRSKIDALATEAQRLVAGHLGSPIVDVGTPAPGMRLVALPAEIVAADRDSDGLRQGLARDHGIECAITAFGGETFVRLSSHAYNTLDDYRRLAHAVVAVSSVSAPA